MKKALNRVGKKMNLVFALLIVLLIAAVVLLNAVALVLANRYPLSLDLTANAAYEIGSDTKTILAGLSDDVTIDVLSDENAFSQDAYLMQAKRILDQYPRTEYPSYRNGFYRSCTKREESGDNITHPGI